MAENGIDWLSFALGFVAAIAVMIFFRRKKGRADLDVLPPMPVVVPAEVRALALKYRAEGRMIDAVKLVRERSGCDLKSAKEFVDHLR